MAHEETRKGPWTEQEDSQLLWFVDLFGDRRWDFIAKVSGLKVAGDTKTGKSCRLRWVNYLHPGLKRSKMSPQEERLVLELHSQFGNRWSKIARKLPGRTDNEIKNYWRTQTRKKAQEKKRPPSSSNCSPTASNNPTVDSMATRETGEEIFYDTGGIRISSSQGNKSIKEDSENGYSMDNIWEDIDTQPEESILKPICSFTCAMASPPWNYWAESLWKMEEEESKMILPTNDQVTHLIRF